MGNRRLSRKRLYEVEKKGQTIDLGAAIGIKDAIVSASQHRNGQELITEIAIDIGTSKAAIKGGGGAGQPFGTASAAAAITELTVAKYGIITEVRALMMELPTSDSTAVVDVDLHFGNNGTGAQGGSITGGTEILADLTAVGEDTSKFYDGNELSGKFLYLVNGNGTGNSSSDVQTGGKFLIYIHGFVAPADL